jgi:uncharacterized membrane protein
MPVVALAGPGSVLVVTQGWTESVVVMLLGLVAYATYRGHAALGAAALGLLCVSKQYVVVILPCLFLLRPWLTRRKAAVAGATAALCTAPFILVNTSAFWHSIVEFQLAQPFRPDSVSLLVWSVITFGWPPPAVFGVLPIVAGLATAVAVTRIAPSNMPSFISGVGLSVLAMVLFSKQGHPNYYFLVGMALLIASWGTFESTRMTSAETAEDVAAASDSPR